ncbi:hypothetical protein AURDEDRAFT_129480 [Auricularia subglabra TFB-10046 SS5]|nr:hypothetical protein AURDEDRAFT_129480 [Auricularia subglabra TFB-10046 SS5]
MGRAVNLHALLELYCSRPQPDPLPDDPADPCYFPFSDEVFLASAHLTGNPLCPPSPTRPHPLKWSARVVQDAHYFAQHFMSLGATKTRRSEQERPGQCQKGESPWWTLREILGTQWMYRLSEQLDAAGHGLNAIMKENSVLPTLHQMRESIDLDLLQSMLFSKDLVLPDADKLALSEFLKFTAQRIASHWQNVYKSDGRILAELEKPVAKFYDKLRGASLRQLKMSDLRNFVRAFGRMKLHVGTRDWASDSLLMDEYVAFCEDTAAALGVHPDSERSARLPPAFLNQLKALAPADKDAIANEFQHLTSDEIESGGSADIPHVLEMNDAGIARLMAKPISELYAMFGATEEFIPYVARWISSDPTFNSWSQGDRAEEWAAATEAAARGEESTLLAFALLKHQLVGLIQLLIWFMDRKPGLLLDDVGLGKTIQTLALAALLAWFSDQYDLTGKFPGTLFRDRHYKHLHPLCTGDNSTCPVREHDCAVPGSHRRCTGDPDTCPCKTEHGNIPDFPSIVVPPTTLASQWASQANSLLLNGKMSILPLVVPNERVRAVISREHLLNEKSPFHALGKTSLLIIVSAKLPDNGKQTLECEFTTVTGWRAADVRKHPIHAPYPSLPDNAHSLYGLEYNVLYIDEMQGARTPGTVKFHALNMLKTQATIVIGLTATPIVNGIGDVVSLGVLAGVPEFSDEPSFKANVLPAINAMLTLKNKAAAARRVQRGAFKEFDNDTMVTESAEVLQTEGALVRPTTDTVAAGKIALDLRGLFPNVIRRTLADVGHDDGLPPITNVTLELYPGAHEYDQTQNVLQSLMQGKKAAVATVLSKQFYLYGRKTAIHWCLATQNCSINAAHFPSSISDFQDNASVKLEAVRYLVQAHLQDRQLPPQTVRFRDGVNEWADGSWSEPLEDGKPARDPSMKQKLVIYTFFVEALNIIRRLLELDGHRVFAIDGQTKLDRRATTLDEWLAHDGPCVLIITTIGTAGLNLQNADILIILDPTWSGSDAAQLAGRIYRKGQKSRTLVYNIVVRKSADVLIRAISSPKKFINDAFLGSTRQLCAC